MSTMQKMHIPAIIEMVRGLTGPDREVDRLIQAWSVGATAEWQDYKKDYAYHRGGSWVSIGEIQPYTASVDAAIALAERVLPGCGCGFDIVPQRRIPIRAWLNQSDDQWTYDGWPVAEGPAPAIALVLAILTALQSEGRDG